MRRGWRTQRTWSTGLVLATSLMSGAVAHAQAMWRGDTISAVLRDVRYDVTFKRANADDRSVRVMMTAATTGTGSVVLSLPAWTPGAYEMSNFARWVTEFEATADGKPARWEKLDYDTWRIHPSGAKQVRVSYRYVADTLDNAMSWSRSDFLLMNGTNVFMYPEGQPLDFPSTVAVHTEAEWRVATGLGAGGSARTYSAATYHDLVDMPFFIGRFDLDSARVANTWVRLATYPAGSISGTVRATAWDQIKRVIPPHVAVFGEVPWDEYTIMQIVDSSYGGASGLEHQNSHVDVFAPSYIGSEFQPSLYAHEIFHAWNVNRLRPAEMWPYQYAHPQPTPLLWVSEGVTDYYADLAEVRGGVVDPYGFYALIAEKINEVSKAPPTTLEDASLNTWMHPVDGTEYLYYAKGSLAALMIDVMIRDASDNRKSLDDVMRALYQSAFKRGRGFTSADWWNAVTAASGGKSFTAFAARYVAGRDAFPWDSILPMVGLRARRDRSPRLGVVTQLDGSAVTVVNVMDGSSAASAGVKPGDVLISVGAIPVDDEQFGAKMRARYGGSIEGSPLPIRVKRGADAITLAGALKFATDVSIEADPVASPKAIRIRNGILKGSTGG